jgi:hypothetical protein
MRGNDGFTLSAIYINDGMGSFTVDGVPDPFTGINDGSFP